MLTLLEYIVPSNIKISEYKRTFKSGLKGKKEARVYDSVYPSLTSVNRWFLGRG